MAETQQPPGYAAERSPPAYEELLRRFDDAAGSNPTPEKCFAVADTFTVEEVETIIANADIKPPPLESEADKKKFRSSAARTMNQAFTKEILAGQSDEAVKSALELRSMFREIHLAIVEIDQISYSGFEPKMRAFMEEYDDILSASRRSARDIETSGRRFDTLLVPLCMDEGVSAELRVRKLKEFIAEAKGFKTGAEDVHKTLMDFQIRFTSFVATFETWSQGREGELNAKIKMILKEITTLKQMIEDVDQKIDILKAVMAMSGFLLLGALAGGPLGIIFAIGGVVGVGASAALLAFYNRKRTSYQRDLLSWEGKVGDAEQELAIIQRARTKLLNLRNSHIGSINANILILDGFWTTVISDATELLEWLENSEDYAEYPDYIEEYLNESIRVYNDMADHIARYADGISGTRDYKESSSQA